MRKSFTSFSLLLFLISSLTGVSQTWDWGSKLQGNSTSDIIVVRGVDTDANGNTFVTGYFNGQITTPSGTITSVGDDIFVARFDASGNPVYAFKGGGGGDDRAMGISYETYGNGAFYITGSVQFYDLAWSIVFQGPSSSYTMPPVTNCSYNGWNIGNGPSADQVFVAKFSASGTPLWAQPLYGFLSSNCTATNSSEGLAVSATYRHTTGMGFERHVYVTGYFRGDVGIVPKSNCGYIQITGNSAHETAFVTKLNGSNGSAIWARSLFSGHSYSSSMGMSITSDIMNTTGNVYILGNFSHSITTNAYTAAAGSGNCTYVARLSGNNGTYNWTRQLYSPSGQVYAKDIACYIDNYQLYLTGDFRANDVRISGSSLIGTGAGDDDVYVARMNASTGAANWLVAENSWYSQIGSSIDLSADGSHVYTCGAFDQQMTFTNGTQLNTTRTGWFENDHYLAKYDANSGSLVCASRYDADFWGHPSYGSTIPFCSTLKSAKSGDHIYMAGLFADFETPQIGGGQSTTCFASMYLGHFLCCDCPPAVITNIQRDPIGTPGATNATIDAVYPDCMASTMMTLIYRNLNNGLINTMPISIGMSPIFIGGLDPNALYEWRFMTSCDAGAPMIRSAEDEASEAPASLGVYPNPANDKVRLEVPDAKSGLQWTIFDASGRRCLDNGSAAAIAEGSAMVIDVTLLPAGTYLLRWNSGTESGSHPLIIAR